MSQTRASEFSMKGLIVLLAVVILLYVSQLVLIPFAFALTLALLLAPAVASLEKHASRTVSVTAVTIITSIGLFFGAYIVSRQVVSVAQTLPQYRTNIHNRMASLHSPGTATLENGFRAMEEIGGDLASPDTGTPPALGTEGSANAPTQPEAQAMPVRVVDSRWNRLAAIGELAQRVLKPIGQVGVVVVFTIYMLMKREELRNRLLLLAGMGRIHLMSTVLEDATIRISKYLIMQIEVNLCYGALFGAGLFLIGVPNATLWGLIAAVFRIVPYVGTTVAVVLPLVISIAVSTSWWPPLLVVGLFLLLELTAANFVEPWLYSSRTGISSLALLGMAIFWMMIWGWSGLVLSTPLTVCFVILGRHVPQMNFLNILLGTNAELSPPAHYYERLLTMDEKEARKLAERYLNGKRLEDLYDSMVIPALSLAEEDRHKGALDDARSNFIFLSVGELVARLNGYGEPGDIPLSNESLLLEEHGNPKPQEFAVVCISASDQADELTSMMLTQLLEQAGHPTLLLPAEAISEEILAGLAQEPSTVLFVSALPPFAFAQVQAICHKVHTHIKMNRVVVGLWNTYDDAEELGHTFGGARPNSIVRTMGEAVRRVEIWRKEAHRA